MKPKTKKQISIVSAIVCVAGTVVGIYLAFGPAQVSFPPWVLPAWIILWIAIFMPMYSEDKPVRSRRSKEKPVNRRRRR